MLVNNWRLVLVALMVSVLVCLLFLFIPTGRVFGAPDTLDLQLDDPAIIRWDIADIKPGDSGTQPINLHNAGDIPGYVYIWLSDIVDSEGLNPESETGNTAEPGELSTCVNLNIINPGMTFGKLTGTGYMQYYDLPVNMVSFPSSSNQALFIIATTINPGETLELQWQWQLPPNVGDQVQGDTVSFTFNYMLSTFYTEEEEEEIEPTTPPFYYPAPTVPPTTPATTTPTVEPPFPARIYMSDDGMCVVYIPEGLHVFTDSGEELTDIIIDTPASTPPSPELYRYAGKTYRILSYAGDGWEESTKLQQKVKLTLYFDPDKIPEGSSVFLVSYHPDGGWIKLDATGGLAEGRLTAWVDCLNPVALIYEIDVSYVTLIAPDTTTPPVPDTEETPDLKAKLAQASLGVAVSGTLAMTTLAIIERIRRQRRMKMEN
jgi:hypothetical protein